MKGVRRYAGFDRRDWFEQEEMEMEMEVQKERRMDLTEAHFDSGGDGEVEFATMWFPAGIESFTETRRASFTMTWSEWQSMGSPKALLVTVREWSA